MTDMLLGKMVEIHLLNGNRFLGEITERDHDGVIVRCLPMRVMDTAPEGEDLADQMTQMLHTLFFPYVNIEYMDIGGEPLGFDVLFANFFGGRKLTELFERHL